MMPVIDRRRQGTNLWRGIVKCWSNFQLNLIWKLGNGRSIHFWEDYWVPGSGNLNQFCTNQSRSGANVPVCFLVDASGGWDSQRLNSELPMKVVEKFKE